MADETPEAGNASLPAAGNAGSTPADVTGNETGRNAADEANVVALNKSLQEKAARTNAAEREAAELKAENERLRKAQSPAAPASGADPRQQAFRDTHAWAQGKDGMGPDPVARVALEAAIGNETLRQELAERDTLDEVDDPTLRRQVKQHMADNRRQGREIDVRAALAEVQVRSAEEMRAENARLREALKTAQQPNGAAPVLQSREVPAGVLNARAMSHDEYEESRRGLTSFQILKLEEQVGRGEIKIKG